MQQTSWFFVQQPNGLLARYSRTIVGCTHYNLSRREALDVGIKFLEPKATKALIEEATKSPQMNWEQVLKLVEETHGEFWRKEMEMDIEQGCKVA